MIMPITTFFLFAWRVSGACGTAPDTNTRFSYVAAPCVLVQNCFFSDMNVGNVDGTAIYIQNDTLEAEVRYASFVRCKSVVQPGWIGTDGTVWFQGLTFKLTGCCANDCHATRGKFVYCKEHPTLSSYGHFRLCTMVLCGASENQGTVVNSDYGDPNPHRGGLFFENNVFATISHFNFTSCRAMNWGAAIWCKGMEGAFNASYLTLYSE
jgi:hypothetical protein